MARRRPDTPRTAQALIEQAARRFRRAGLHFGHGTDNAVDEAAFLVLHGAGLPIDADADVLERELPAAAIAAARALVDARIERRCPAAYLTNRMWFAGHEFRVDERVLVPRSPLAELVNERFAPWLADEQVTHILDIGTGSGCIALACALAFPHALVDATDVSADALAVAAENRARHGLEARVALHEADVFPPGDTRYDLIVSNPPYVPRARAAELPDEYRAEPAQALFSGDDGFDCLNRILAGARARLRPHGVLVVEVGEIWEDVDARHPELPFTWLEFAHGGEGVFLLRREELPGVD